MGEPAEKAPLSVGRQPCPNTWTCSTVDVGINSSALVTFFCCGSSSPTGVDRYVMSVHVLYQVSKVTVYDLKPCTSISCILICYNL